MVYRLNGWSLTSNAACRCPACRRVLWLTPGRCVPVGWRRRTTTATFRGTSGCGQAEPPSFRARRQNLRGRLSRVSKVGGLELYRWPLVTTNELLRLYYDRDDHNQSRPKPYSISRLFSRAYTHRCSTVSPVGSLPDSRHSLYIHTAFSLFRPARNSGIHPSKSFRWVFPCCAVEGEC